MDEQKKQKVLLALVAVVFLGAGSVWYFTRDTGVGSSASVQSGPVQRKVRNQSDQTVKKTSRKKKRVRRDATAEAVTRKERKTADRQTVERKKRKGRRDKKVKKEVIAPAA